ncbi:unnamed protein product [Heligmosomoides polygyrus]|uniref:Metalloprotease TIKI homolog n=1 Tax=Heligmosomoides polygyrus TaxID=6339 RepID=A0A183FRP4_HELPZ|nr:unnamed protein product [Heligmosomoides polygyrus]
MFVIEIAQNQEFALTVHKDSKSVPFAVSDRVREAFSYSDTVLLEIDLRNEDTVKRLIRCKNLKRKQTTASYLHPKLHQRIKECESFYKFFVFDGVGCGLELFMEKFQRALINSLQGQEVQGDDSYRMAKDIYDSIVGNWDRKRPEWLLFALYQLCENLINRPSTPMLDVFLANKAHEEEKQIRAIETTREQCNPIATVSQEEERAGRARGKHLFSNCLGTAVVFGAEDEDAFQIIFAINYTVHYLEHLHRTKMLFSVNSHRSLSALVKEYRCGNLDEQYFESNEFSMNGFNMGESEKLRAEKIHRHLRDDIISKRNERMAYRLDQLLSTNPHMTIFTAIGTGHFFGNNSILHHLHNMGYTIRSINDEDVMYNREEQHLSPLMEAACSGAMPDTAGGVKFANFLKDSLDESRYANVLRFPSSSSLLEKHDLRSIACTRIPQEPPSWPLE